MFLRMYCPTKVSANGAEVKDIPGSRNRGVKVQIMCTSTMRMTTLEYNPEISKTPMAVSHNARSNNDNPGVINFRVSR